VAAYSCIPVAAAPVRKSLGVVLIGAKRIVAISKDRGRSYCQSHHLIVTSVSY
jgi:hypothetical protein